MSDKSFKERVGDAAVRFGFVERQPVINANVPNIKEFTRLSEAGVIGAETLKMLDKAEVNLQESQETTSATKQNLIQLPPDALSAYRAQIERNYREAA